MSEKRLGPGNSPHEESPGIGDPADARHGRRVLSRMVLEGGAKLGDVPASDIARFIDGVVRTIAKAAGHAVGREVRQTGRWQGAVAAASEVRLVAIRPGSIEFVFAPAPQEVGPQTLGLDVETLSERALAIAVSAAGDDSARYRDVARSWVKTADALGIGARYQRVRILSDRKQLAVIDGPSLDVLREVAGGRPREAVAMLQGRLYEANFDARTATLRTPTGEVVQVQYGQEHADDIYRVLRGPANLRGDVSYDPVSSRALRVRVTQIESPRQMHLGEFWQEHSLPGVIREQHLTPIQDPQTLVIPGLTADDWRVLREGFEP